MSEPNSNRRISPRRKPKGSSRALSATGKYGLGPNVAIALLDISEAGARLIVKADLPPGHEIEIGFDVLGERRPVVVSGHVVWSLTLTDGNHCVGIQFDKYLTYAVLQAISYI